MSEIIKDIIAYFIVALTIVIIIVIVMPIDFLINFSRDIIRWSFERVEMKKESA